MENNAYSNTNNNLFAGSQPYAYDNLNLYQNDIDPNLNDAGWGVNATNSFTESRGQQQPWQNYNASHLSASAGPADYTRQASPYGQPVHQNHAAFAPTPFTDYTTPQSFQYQPSQYDAPQYPPPANGHHFNQRLAAYNAQSAPPATIAPQALQHEVRQPSHGGNPYQGSGSAANGFDHFAQNRPAPRFADQRTLAAKLPNGSTDGMFSVMDSNMNKATNPTHVAPYFSHHGSEPMQWEGTAVAQPAHAQKNSQQGTKALAGNGANISAQLGNKSHKTKTPDGALGIRPFKIASEEKIMYEGDSSGSDDDSASDEDESGAPLPAKRPEAPKAAVQYDTIKALWRSKGTVPAVEDRRKAVGDFWDVVSTIRDRWKDDTAAVAKAEEKKRVGDLPLLQGRVKDQRDMIEIAFKAALKHGHRSILELLGGSSPLVFICYQFLVDRFKADDCNGGLARAILETMSLFTNLSKEMIEKTHLVKIFPRYQKKVDARTGYYLKKIIANSENVSAGAALRTSAPPEQKKAGSALPGTSASTPPKAGGPEPVAGIKRPASTSAEGTTQKKIAMTNTKATGSSTAAKPVGAAVKKAAVPGNAAKPATQTASATVARKVAPPKPSGFFSNLQSAQKKPGTSNAEKAMSSNLVVGKAPVAAPSAAAPSAPARPAFSFSETMANLSKPKEQKPPPKPEKEVPSETPEQCAQRLRKEERRKLTVAFKKGDDLEQIRYFTHDPEEEINHDASQMRDVSDVGGEGRMFKQQHQMMDIDEDEAAEEGENLIAFQPPSLIDFSSVDAEERKRNYFPHGGGETLVDSPERAIRERVENNTLLVFYTDWNQIPPNPREPADPYTGEPAAPFRPFGTPDDPKWALRARMRRAATAQAQRTGFAQPAIISAPPAAPPVAPIITPDIQRILATLSQAAPAQPAPYAQPQQPQPPAYIPPPFATQPVAPPIAVPSIPDLAAILATLQKNNPAPPAAPAAPSMGYGNNNNNNAAPAHQFGNTGTSEAVRRKQNPLYKTRPCKYWAAGKSCQYGEACSFLHE